MERYATADEVIAFWRAAGPERWFTRDHAFDALADARTYPRWWRPVYIAVDADSPPGAGCVSRQEFKGRLPYHLKTRSAIVRMDRPREFEVSVEGDLTGRGVWTLTPVDDRVHIRFDWRVIADRPMLRYLTPVLRPVFRWNHNWSVKRAIEGLEPYARGRSQRSGN